MRTIVWPCHSLKATLTLSGKFELQENRNVEEIARRAEIAKGVCCDQFLGNLIKGPWGQHTYNPIEVPKGRCFHEKNDHIIEKLSNFVLHNVSYHTISEVTKNTVISVSRHHSSHMNMFIGGSSYRR